MIGAVRSLQSGSFRPQVRFPLHQFPIRGKLDTREHVTMVRHLRLALTSTPRAMERASSNTPGRPKSRPMLRRGMDTSKAPERSNRIFAPTTPGGMAGRVRYVVGSPTVQ